MSIVLLDCDGVLADFITPALKVVEKHTGVLYKEEHFDDWDFIKVIRDNHGHEVVDKCYDDFHREGFVFDLPVYPGAVEGVARLRKVADVFVVTSPMHSRHWYYERVEWLKTFFGFKNRSIIHCGTKRLVQGNMLVDDKPANLVDWGNFNSGVPVLWDRPYNKKDALPFRTDNWGALLGLLRNT